MDSDRRGTPQPSPLQSKAACALYALLLAGLTACDGGGAAAKDEGNAGGGNSAVEMDATMPDTGGAGGGGTVASHMDAAMPNTGGADGGGGTGAMDVDATIPDAGGDGGDGGDLGPVDHVTFGSGSRLRAHYYDGGGGAEQLLYFHDTVLDLDCRFTDRGDGSYFCFPIAAGGFRFSDAACAVPVYDGPGGIGAGDFVTFGVRRSCDDRVAAYEVGPEVDVTAFYIAGSGARCIASFASGGKRPSLTRLDDARFVEGIVSVVGDGALRAVRLDGSDGSYQHIALADANGHQCSEITVAGEARCVPGPVPTVDANGRSYFTDAACTMRDAAVLAFAGSAVCPARAPEVVSVADSGSSECAPRSRKLLRATDMLSDDSGIFIGAPGSCQPVATSDTFQGQSYYHFGAEVAGSEFPPIPQDAEGTGALRLDHATGDGGRVLLQREYVDSWRLPDGSACWLDKTTGGSRRCLPARSIGLGSDPITEWSDAACSVPLDVRFLSCGETIDYFVQYDANNAVSAVFMAVVYEGPVYYDVGAGCEQVPDLTDWGTRFAIGDPVPLSGFPEVQEVTD